MNGKRFHKEAGFTLVEVLVTISIFAVAALGLAIGAVTVMRGNQMSYYQTIATNLAQDKLEELKGATTANIKSGNDSPKAGPITFSRSWTVTANQPTTGVNKIDVTISWTDYISHNVTVSSAVKQ